MRKITSIVLASFMLAGILGAMEASAAINVSDNGTAEPMSFPKFELDSEGNGMGEWVNATSGFLNITNNGDVIDGSSKWIIINTSADGLYNTTYGESLPVGGVTSAWFQINGGEWHYAGDNGMIFPFEIWITDYDSDYTLGTGDTMTIKLSYALTGSPTPGIYSTYQSSVGNGWTWSISNSTQSFASGYFNVTINVGDYLSAPLDFTATAKSSHTIEVTWTECPAEDSTLIRRKLGDYPADRNDGDFVANVTGWGFLDSGLSPNTHYFYSAWNYNETYRQWSSASHAEATTQPNNGPTADFTYSLEGGLTVTFTDASTDSDGSIVNWSWNFGDGSTSYEQNPTHNYSSAGNHTVTLTVTDNDGGTNTVQKTVVVGSNPPVADFSYVIKNETTVIFTDLSTDNGSIVNWSWNFGDGSTSYEQNPTHNYSSAGNHTVTLTVTDNDGLIDSATKTVTYGGGGLPDNSSNWFNWKLPLSWFSMFIIGMIGLIGISMAAFFLKPESIKHVGYAPAAGTLLITAFLVGAILMYHAGVAWYWIAGVVLLIFFILYVTLKVVAIKKKKLVKSVFGHKKVRRKR